MNDSTLLVTYLWLAICLRNVSVFTDSLTVEEGNWKGSCRGHFSF